MDPELDIYFASSSIAVGTAFIPPPEGSGSSACISIKVSGGQERSVYDHLQKRPEVRDVYRLFGEYSFFLVMQAEERNGLSRMLRELEARENVIKTGPVLLTAEEGGPERHRTDFAVA